MNCLVICISILNALSAQVQATAPAVSEKPTSVVEWIVIISGIIVTIIICGISGTVFARFAADSGMPYALIILFFWLGVFLSCFAIVPIVVIFFYKRYKRAAEVEP